MKPLLLKNKQQSRRKAAVRSRIRQRSALPRLSVARSSKHISVQIIDDVRGCTLAAATSIGKEQANSLAGKSKTERAQAVGALIAERAKAAGIESVVFDRGPYKYHGRIKALADAARESGLKF